MFRKGPRWAIIYPELSYVVPMNSIAKYQFDVFRMADIALDGPFYALRILVAEIYNIAD